MKNNKLNKNRFIFSSTLIGLIIAVWCCQLNAYPFISFGHHFGVPSNTQQASIPGLNNEVLRLATTAYNKAKYSGIATNEHLTIVDYSLPSSAQRMWVINMRTNTVVHLTHVAHGVRSGDNYAHTFSNQHGSNMSSLGVFVTGDMYNGKYGKSLHLHGLDGKFNSNAFARRIVVHQAHYVDENIINKIGRLGRSFGCLALNKKVAADIMQTIKDGSLVFCYYPDKAWLRESVMLRA